MARLVSPSAAGPLRSHAHGAAPLGMSRLIASSSASTWFGLGLGLGLGLGFGSGLGSWVRVLGLGLGLGEHLRELGPLRGRLRPAARHEPEQRQRRVGGHGQAHPLEGDLG